MQTELDQLRPTENLLRFEFFELLLRLAGAKYKIAPNNPNGKFLTYSESVQQFLEDITFRLDPGKYFPEVFRTKELWQLDVNKVFEVN